MIEIGNMKLQTIFACILSTLFFSHAYAISSDAVLCNQMLAKGDVAAALAQANSQLKTHENDKDVLICQGRALTANGNLDAALAAFKLADAQSAAAFDKTIIALLSGHAYKSAKQYEQAVANYQQTIAQAKIAKSQSFELMANNAIGDVYFDTKQYPLALAAYLAGNKLTANDNERGESHEKVALTYYAMKQTSLALEYQIKAFMMLAAVGTLDQYAHSGIELGRYYTIEKNYVSATNVLNKMIKFAKEQGGAYYEAQGSYMLAKVKAATGDTEAAKGLVEYAKLIAKNTHDQALDEEIRHETQNLVN